jgi:hypothetical protein
MKLFCLNKYFILCFFLAFAYKQSVASRFVKCEGYYVSPKGDTVKGYFKLERSYGKINLNQIAHGKLVFIDTHITKRTILYPFMADLLQVKINDTIYIFESVENSLGFNYPGSLKEPYYVFLLLNMKSESMKYYLYFAKVKMSGVITVDYLVHIFKANGKRLLELNRKNIDRIHTYFEDSESVTKYLKDKKYDEIDLETVFELYKE